jgi:hypothetical protein
MGYTGRIKSSRFIAGDRGYLGISSHIFSLLYLDTLSELLLLRQALVVEAGENFIFVKIKF